MVSVNVWFIGSRFFLFRVKVGSESYNRVYKVVLCVNRVFN